MDLHLLTPVTPSVSFLGRATLYPRWPVAWGNQCGGVFGQWVPEENLGVQQQLPSFSLCFPGNKETRTVAGESARARKPGMQSVSNAPFQLETCQPGYEPKEQNLQVPQEAKQASSWT